MTESFTMQSLKNLQIGGRGVIGITLWKEVTLMKLTFDLPKEYNDMSRSEIARLAVQVKKLVDDLNYILNNISEDNLSIALRDKINTASDNATECLESISKMEEGEVNVSSVDEVFSEDS